MLQRHVKHLFVLVLVEECLVLVDDPAVALIKNLSRSCEILRARLFAFLATSLNSAPNFKSVLHELREHLRELDLCALLRFVIGLELLGHKFVVHCRVE